jgi:hypothetical protein
LVDYVSECAADAGKSAAERQLQAKNTPAPKTPAPKPATPSARIERGEGMLSYVPQRIDLSRAHDKVKFYFRSASEMDKAVLSFTVDGKEVFSKKFSFLRPPEMERIEVDFTAFNLTAESKLSVSLKEV